MSPQKEKTSSLSCSARPRKHREDPLGELIDLDLYSETPAFDDDELATFEEFETMSKHLERIDKPASTPKTLPPRRKKTKRRRQIDPATCERDYSTEEVEFMNALNEYKRSSGRMFPTCSEILEVLKNLGYEKVSE